MGRVGKPHGIHGWVTVMPTTDEPERRFAVGAEVLIDGLPRTVIDSRFGRPLALLLDGMSDRADAEALRGTWLYVDVAGEAGGDDDEFYDHQLEGLEVRVGDRTVGTVAEVLHLPAQDVLQVSLPDGRNALVPFVADIVPVVDPVAGFVEVVELEGMFDAD